jgi:membrane-associated phospholipid phosphatase
LLHSLWRFLTDFGDTAVTVPLAVLVAGLLFAAKEPRLATGWVLVIAGCTGLTGGLKLLFTVCAHPAVESRMLSPSGHTAMSIAVYGGIAAIAGHALRGPARAALTAGAAVFTIGIALSRTIVGHHTPIEVAIGLLIGIAALGAMIVLVGRHPPERLPLRWLFAGAVVVFVLFHGTRWPAERAIHRFAWWFDILRPWCS